MYTYADMINTPSPPIEYEYLTLFWTVDIILIVLIVAIVVLVKIRKRK